MYHCQVQFYLLNFQHYLFEVIGQVSPLENFTHEFTESSDPDEKLLKEADVIFADLQGKNEAEILSFITSHKKKEAQVLLLADKEQTGILMEQDTTEVTDIWTLPLSKKEILFRFARWQQSYKRDMDFWQTRNYLDTTINSVPHLIWYKDKQGIHMKVNESFCKAVNKTMEQIEGRGHYYIWDIEPDEYAKGEYICMESEYEVMNKRETCVFDENVKIGDSMRQLKTYKSPLFDLDGSVMGTVGVAMDVTQERIYEQMIINNANTDFLTGLYNRRYAYQFMEQEKNNFLTAFYLDLDNFKSVNDMYGHQEGDRALIITTETLQKIMPDSMIARIGGDEFLIIQSGEQTQKEIEDRRLWIQNQLDKVYANDEYLKGISVSIGTANSDKGKITLDEMIGEADGLMYHEKNRKKRIHRHIISQNGGKDTN